MIDFLASALKLAGIPYRQNEPLAPKSTFRIGGTAQLFVAPETPEQFESAVGAARATDAPFFIVGGGSNVVFPDGEYTGVIISTQNLKEIFFESDQSAEDGSALVTCQCGVPMASLVDFCLKKNLGGAEQFAGLPGTIGGALFMNARCFDRSISELFHSAHYFEFSGKQSLRKELSFSTADWDYKKSPFQPEPVQDTRKYLLEASFRLTRLPSDTENHARQEAECKKYITERVEKGHFKFPSAGSVFKNNHAFGAPSGKLIDECGLKGLQIGGAQIAPFHGNFIININHASANDVRQLVEAAQKSVKEKFGFNLEPEIIFV